MRRRAGGWRRERRGNPAQQGPAGVHRRRAARPATSCGRAAPRRLTRPRTAARSLSMVNSVKWVDEVLQDVPYDVSESFMQTLFEARSNARDSCGAAQRLNACAAPARRSTTSTTSSTATTRACCRCVGITARATAVVLRRSVPALTPVALARTAAMRMLRRRRRGGSRRVSRAAACALRVLVPARCSYAAQTIREAEAYRPPRLVPRPRR